MAAAQYLGIRKAAWLKENPYKKKTLEEDIVLEMFDCHFCAVDLSISHIGLNEKKVRDN